MKRFKENLLLHFSLLSVVFLAAISTGLAAMLTNRLERVIGLLRDHGAAMMSGTMIKPSDPYSIPSLTADVNALETLTYIGVGVGFGVLYLGLVAVVWRGWGTIIRQRTQLENLNEELAGRVESRVQELRDSNDQLRRQIQDRQRAEDDLRQTNIRLEDTLSELQKTQRTASEQERMRALGQMASGIAHDFNNALSPVLTMSGMLLEPSNSLDNKEQLIGDLEMIHTAAQDATKVVRRLRDFYRSPDPSDEAQELDLNDQVRRAVELTRPLWMQESQAQGIRIDVEMDLPEMNRISGSESEIREALTNLILNAVDAMPEGGTIAFRTRADDGQAVMEVIDTGTGMPQEVLDKCMDPFFSTKGESGSGMGLAMVHGILMRHGATYEVKSEVDEGTAFTIRFPFHLDTAESRQRREKTQAIQRPIRPLHLLVVDDDSKVLMALRRLLTSDGHSLDAATDGREGLEKFQASKFDVVVTDRAMPGMSGDQLAAAIRELAPDQPIIMITGFGDIMDASGEISPNVNAVVSKPIDPAELRRVLFESLGTD